MNRKTLIKNKALELFNEHGSRNVTTNNIVESLNLSPGNFYYYFKNKEAVILEIFTEMVEEWNSDEYQLDKVLLTEEVLLNMLQKTGEFFWKYRFIHKELVFLIENDNKLKEYNHQIQKIRLQQLRTMINYNIEQGVFRKLKSEEKDFFIDFLWIGSLFWQPYLEVTDQINTSKSLTKITSHFLLLFNLFKNYKY